MDDTPSALALMVMPPFGWIVAGIWGALWGSFFNVAIYRVGLYESVTRPRSRCPGCGQPIAAYDNIPIVSWVLLRGRCRRCQTSISVRYPLVELASCLLALAVYWRYVAIPGGDEVVATAHFMMYFAFVGCLLVLSGIDIDHQLLPDAITFPAIPLCLVTGVLLRDEPAGSLVIGAFAGYAVIAITAELSVLLLRREGMGYGDAKLLAMVGALLGWKAVIFTFFVAPFLGMAVLLPPRLLRRQKLRGQAVPYGPFLAAAAVIWVLYPPRAWPFVLRDVIGLG